MSGLTLIEVLAGLAILSTLLVTILVAFGRHADQIRTAQGRLAAIDAADRLLTEWTAGGSVPPAGDEGMIEGAKGLRWRSVRSESQVPNHFNAHVVRLEVYRPSGEMPERILASVEILVAGGSGPVDR